MEAPLVSIGCITYNHAPYIRQCLEGFLMQKTTFPFEIIINDDCSTDGTTEIVKEYADKYPDLIIPIFHEENQYQKGVRGIYAKFVYPKVRGKYIALCEGDDYWIDPLKLQKQVDFLEEHPECSMCFHRCRELVEDDIKIDISSVFQHLEERYYTGEEILRKWTVPTASVVYRNCGIYMHPLLPGMIWGDTFMFLQLANKGQLYCLYDIMSVYRRNINSITLKQKRTLPYETIVNHYKILENFFRPKYSKVINEIVNMYYIKILIRKPFSYMAYESVGNCIRHPVLTARNLLILLSKKI